MKQERQRLLTSTEAADYLGTSPTSIKRWADEGVLHCVKTAGKHRRFEIEELDRFARQQKSQGEATIDLAGWLTDLLEGKPYRVQARLLDARASTSSWRAVCRDLGAVITHLGEAWERGDITVVQEHLASERLARALARVAEQLPTAASAPRALLATLEGEEHTLGLSLVEVCLRELGWQVLWAGRRTPLAGLGEALDHQGVQLLAVSASLAASDPEALGRAAETLALICRPRDVELLLGGSGAWPERPPYGRVMRSLDDLAQLATS